VDGRLRAAVCVLRHHVHLMLGKRNLYLIGPMGTGKTAVGKHLAKVLGLPFHDSDAEIEKVAGVDIPYIFDEEGEAGFRRREHLALVELCALEPIVLATGGGAILDPANRQLLKQSGIVVFLQTSVPQQLQRVGNGRGRPLLKGSREELQAKLEQLRAIREPLYKETADVIIETDGRRVPRVADLILREVGWRKPGETSRRRGR
jgi:shikimate kinase